MKLLVDVGNTRIKWALLDGRDLGQYKASAYEMDTLPELLDDCWSDMPAPLGLSVANVCGAEVARVISAYAGRRWRLEPVYARVRKTEAGVTNAYRDITELGIDRWLGVVAAWKKYRAPLVVAGCGTAVTIDTVDDGGRHLGGLIIPGMRLMRNSLYTGTHGIAAAGTGDPAMDMGDSTASCVANGAVWAVVSALERAGADMELKFGEGLQRLISGGDAAAVNGLLKRPYILEPNLVLEGLAITTET